MTVADAFVALAAGLVAGMYSGLLGVGGGIVLVPAMVLLLGQPQHTAEGTSLLVIIPTAVVGTRAMLRRGLVDVPIARRLAGPGAIGAAAGALIALEALPDERALRRVFAVFLLAVALRLLTRRAPRSP